MYDSPFRASGPTVLVGVTAVQVSSVNSVNPSSYRIRNITNLTAYIGWASPNVSTTPPVISTTAPVAGTPSSNLISMSGGSVEVLTFPQNAYFQSSVAAGFEITPGEGN